MAAPAMTVQVTTSAATGFFEIFFMFPPWRGIASAAKPLLTMAVISIALD
jgi:hypothetical protein